MHRIIKNIENIGGILSIIVVIVVVVDVNEDDEINMFFSEKYAVLNNTIPHIITMILRVNNEYILSQQTHTKLTITQPNKITNRI